jgi:signal transduction histidine kinase
VTGVHLNTEKLIVWFRIDSYFIAINRKPQYKFSNIPPIILSVKNISRYIVVYFKLSKRNKQVISISKFKNLLLLFIIMILLFNFFLLFNFEHISELIKITILVSLIGIGILSIICYYLFDKYIKNLSDEKTILEAKLIDALDKNLKKDLILQQQSSLATIGYIAKHLFTQWKQYLNIITISSSGIKFKQDYDIAITQDDINKMNDNIQRSAKVISDIIYNFNNLSNNTQGVNRFIVEDSVESALSIMKVLFKDFHIEVKTDFDDNIELIGLKHLLSQVILNILINSLDEFAHTHVQKKVIKMSLVKENNNIIIKIKDNAGGISIEAMDRLYEMLFTTKKNISNMGMGLYTCVQILENYFQGYILHENVLDEDGLGACFTLEIPCK